LQTILLIFSDLVRMLIFHAKMTVKLATKVKNNKSYLQNFLQVFFV